jgi:hypothetical protein
VLIRLDLRAQPSSQGRGRDRRQLRAGERADGGLGTLADGRVVQGGHKPHELAGGARRE